MAITNSLFFNRLEQLKNSLKIETERAFAKKIGITYGNYNSYKKGAQPTLTIMVNILSNIEGLNPSWLVLGDEPMFIEKNESNLLVKDKGEDYNPVNKEERLLIIIESQQRTIESQQRMIEEGTKKDTAGAV